MTNKLRNNTIKSYKIQNRQDPKKPVKIDFAIYFASKITPAFYYSYINKNSI